MKNWKPDEREAYQYGSRNEWRETTSKTDTICGTQKGIIKTRKGCGKVIPSGELHYLKASAWRGQVKGRVWATRLHQDCVVTEIAAENENIARQTGKIVRICMVCLKFMGLKDGGIGVSHGICSDKCLKDWTEERTDVDLEEIS